MGYTLILQHNATRREWLITGLTDACETHLAYVFKDFDMPEGAQEGEYTGVLFWDGRQDTQYELNDCLLDTVCHTEEGDVKVRDLRPEIFLMKYGAEPAQGTYRKSDADYVYYKK